MFTCSYKSVYVRRHSKYSNIDLRGSRKTTAEWRRGDATESQRDCGHWAYTLEAGTESYYILLLSVTS